MTTIKLILRPYEEKSMTLNEPIILNNDSSLSTQCFSGKFKKKNSSSQINLPKKLRNGNEIQLEYNLGGQSSRSKYSNKVVTNNTISSFLDQSSVKIIDIKIFVANMMEVKPDMLNLYIPSGNPVERLKMLNDKDSFFSAQNNFDCKNLASPSPILNQGRFTMSSTSFDMCKPTLLYFKICYEKKKVMVDIYQNKVDKILIEVSPFCSIYMLKYLINQKLLQGTNNINNNGTTSCSKIQNIYGSGLLDKNNKKLTKATSNKKFDDQVTVENIIHYYLSKSNGKSEEDFPPDQLQILNLMLVESVNNKLSMGLDFRFNYFRNFLKMDFDEGAPSYREASDGLNLVIKCLNEKCPLHKETFIKCKGYGSFDILSEVKAIKCPACKSQNVELRSIGMINSKWLYKGLMRGKQESKFDGDGFTLENNKFFGLPEVNYSYHFCLLLFEISFYQCNLKKFTKGANKFEENDLDEVKLVIENKEEKKDIIKNEENNVSDIVIDSKKKRICCSVTGDIQGACCIW